MSSLGYLQTCPVEVATVLEIFFQADNSTPGIQHLHLTQNIMLSGKRREIHLRQQVSKQPTN